MIAESLRIEADMMVSDGKSWDEVREFLIQCGVDPLEAGREIRAYQQALRSDPFLSPGDIITVNSSSKASITDIEVSGRILHWGAELPQFILSPVVEGSREVERTVADESYREPGILMRRGDYLVFTSTVRELGDLASRILDYWLRILDEDLYVQRRKYWRGLFACGIRPQAAANWETMYRVVISGRYYPEDLWAEMRSEAHAVIYEILLRDLTSGS